MIHDTIDSRQERRSLGNNLVVVVSNVVVIVMLVYVVNIFILSTQTSNLCFASCVLLRRSKEIMIIQYTTY